MRFHAHLAQANKGNHGTLLTMKQGVRTDKQADIEFLKSKERFWRENPHLQPIEKEGEINAFQKRYFRELNKKHKYSYGNYKTQII